MKLFALSGSMRTGSYNTKLITLAVAEARRQGSTVALGNFRDLAPPLYDADWEAAHGLPPQALALVREIEGVDAMMIASPEYNCSVAGPLKNALDWVSRLKPYRFKDKPVLLMGSSSGGTGARDGMAALRITLNYQGAAVYPETFSVPHGGKAFDQEGRFTDAAMNEKLTRLIGAFLAEAHARQSTQSNKAPA